MTPAETGGDDLVKAGGVVTYTLVLSTNTTWPEDTALNMTLPSGYAIGECSVNGSIPFIQDTPLTGNDSVTCIINRTVDSVDAGAGSILGGDVIVTMVNRTDLALAQNVSGCTLPNVPVYTGSLIEGAGVALAAGETKFLTGKHATYHLQIPVLTIRQQQCT
jgi:hypothetical protein